MNETTPPPVPPQPSASQPPPAAQPTKTDGMFDAMRRIGIARSQDRWIGGVAGGIARRLGIDPLLVRAIFGISVLFGGLGLIVYGLAWALLPEEIDGRIHLQETLRGQFDVGLLGAIALFVIGLSQGSGWFGWWNDNGFGWLNGILWFAATVALIALVIAAVNQRGDRRPPVGGTAAQGAGAPSVYQYPTAPPTAYPSAPVNAAPTGGYAPPSGYSGPPYGYAGPTGYTPVPPAPPRPAKPRVQGPGAGAIGAVVGLSLLSLAVLLLAERTGDLGWPVWLTAAGIAIVLAGLGIVIAGLRGRSSGTLGFLAIVGVVLAVPAALLHPIAGDWSTDDVRVIVSDEAVWTPSTAADATAGRAAAVGGLNVDLTGVPLSGTTIEVPVSLGAGDLTITVPANTAITANVALAAGDISWEVDREQQISGITGSRSYDFQSNEVTRGTSPELALQIEMGAGQVRIVEENS